MEISDDMLPIGWLVLQYIIGPFVVQPTRNLTISCNNHHFPFRYWRWVLTFKIFQVSQNVVGVQAERMSFGLGVASSPSWNPDTNFAFLFSALRLVRLARDVNSTVIWRIRANFSFEQREQPVKLPRCGPLAATKNQACKHGNRSS